MRLLLDECVPKRLLHELPNHEVRTVPQMGWAAKENGELLGLAESAFDVFVTVDKNMILLLELRWGGPLGVPECHPGCCRPGVDPEC